MKQLGLAFCVAASLPVVCFAESLAYPVDVAVDANGVIFVADHEAHALVKLTDTGVEIVAQGEGKPRTPLYGIRHIAPRPDGSFIASDPATMKLYRIDTSGNVTAVPDDNGFVTPWGISIDDDDILAVDRVSHRLRRIQANGVVEDIAEVKSPRAVLSDKEGNVVVLTDDTLVRITAGEPHAIAPDAPFEFPHDAVLHPDGNFYVSDGYAKAIWRVASDGTVTAHVQGAPLESPQGLAVDRQGNLVVADAHARAIFRITPKGELTRLDQ